MISSAPPCPRSSNHEIVSAQAIGFCVAPPCLIVKYRSNLRAAVFVVFPDRVRESSIDRCAPRDWKTSGVAAVLGEFPRRGANRRARPATDAPPARSSSTARPDLESHSYASRRPPAQVRPRRLTGHSTPPTVTMPRLRPALLLLAARAITTATACSCTCIGADCGHASTDVTVELLEPTSPNVVPCRDGSDCEDASPVEGPYYQGCWTVAEGFPAGSLPVSFCAEERPRRRLRFSN